MFLIRRDDHPGPEAEALSAYVEALVAGGAPAPASDDELAHVARLLHAELHPVEPRPGFADGLRLRLVATADQRAAVDEAPAAWRQPRFIIGAAGLVSAAAVLALVARQRMHAHTAA